jgi:hypothetical protein
MNKKVNQIEGIPTLNSLSGLQEYLAQHHNNVSISDVGMNIITPPGVTLMQMQEAYSLGIRNFFLQPGTSDATVQQFIQQIDLGDDCSVIQDCVLITLV